MPSGEVRNNVSIVVEDNSSLSDCYTLTDFLPGGTHAVSGGIYINNNAGICTNQSALSNTIYRGDITVSTQAAVDALPTTLAGKTIIDGNVITGLYSVTDITDLTPLSSIVRITGDFFVRHNRKLTDLGDFPVLQSIGGGFTVEYNDELTNLGDFSCFANHWGIFYCK